MGKILLFWRGDFPLADGVFRGGIERRNHLVVDGTPPSLAPPDVIIALKKGVCRRRIAATSTGLKGCSVTKPLHLSPEEVRRRIGKVSMLTETTRKLRQAAIESHAKGTFPFRPRHDIRTDRACWLRLLAEKNKP